MTNSAKPAKHGRDHCPGGADPIECLNLATKSFVGTGTTQTFVPGNSSVVWQTNTNRNPECFTPIVLSGSDYYQVQILEDGVYTATVYIGLSSATAFGAADVAISMYRSDRAQHNSRRWTYDATDGFNDGTHQWTFEMDGTGGSTRRIAFQLINFHAAIAGTDDELTGTDIRVEVHKWSGAIAL